MNNQVNDRWRTGTLEPLAACIFSGQSSISCIDWLGERLSLRLVHWDWLEKKLSLWCGLCLWGLFRCKRGFSSQGILSDISPVGGACGLINVGATSALTAGAPMHQHAHCTFTTILVASFSARGEIWLPLYTQSSCLLLKSSFIHRMSF